MIIHHEPFYFMKYRLVYWSTHICPSTVECVVIPITLHSKTPVYIPRFQVIRHTANK